MKKEYTRPGLNVYGFATEDAITTSGTTRVTTAGISHEGAAPATSMLFAFDEFKQ